MKICKFDLELYPLPIIRQAVLDYSGIATIVILPGKQQASCCFLRCRVDEKLTVDEFANYLIDLIGARGHIHDYS